ncbi:EthD domain-containing protein [Pseudomaricurvus alcaniphilus]|uniref:EthD domain-containing protein n=1 Tax=Pseudomaricurvus alcaniphilus TaxID=1166482 RepID=UPI00140743D8|nr:EthD domain-containing protein [Pseudomaricurvus alcaniphilus]NHN39882.1 EthD domain-containing protein [Pseudomaricurvus alcaniphilus]
MYKVILLLSLSAEFSLDQFSAKWVALPWASIKENSVVVSHVHNRGIPGAIPIQNAPAAEFDAIEEFWFASEADAITYFSSYAFREFWNFYCSDMLASEPMTLSGKPSLLWVREVDFSPDPLKIITLPVRNSVMTQEEFAHHWVYVHSPIGLAGPGTKERLQRLEPMPADDERVTEFIVAPFDGAGSIEFSDKKHLQIEFSSDYYKENLAPDELRFTDPSKSFALMVIPFLIQ